MATPGYIIEFRQSQFMRALMAPLSETDVAAAIAEDREERANCWHETWILANAAIAARDADHWGRLHNTFYGDKSRRDSEELKAAEAAAAEDEAALNAKHLKSETRGRASG